MEITFENLGFIKKGKVKTNDITIIFGPNNVGKTYLSYSLFSVLREYRKGFLSVGSVNSKMASSLLADRVYEDDMSAFIKAPNQKDLCEKISHELPRFFKDTNDVLKDARVHVSDINKNSKLSAISFHASILLNVKTRLAILKQANDDKIKFMIQGVDIKDEELSDVDKKLTVKHTLSSMQILINYVIRVKFFDVIEREPFIITSERTGISLFLKEIDYNRNDIVNSIAIESFSSVVDESSKIKKLIEERVSVFAEPINHNINAIRESLVSHSKIKLSKDNSDSYLKTLETFNGLVGGNYKILNDDILFSAKSASGELIDIPMPMASGAGKSLYLFDVFIRNHMLNNSYLIVDEPELNLHPKNQIKMAELLVRLANSGVKVVITTHSDYIVKEINNRIMASAIDNDGLLADLKYESCDLISSDRVNAFTITKDGIIKEVDKNAYGIVSSLFDEAILEVDGRSEKLIIEMMKEHEID